MASSRALTTSSALSSASPSLSLVLFWTSSSGWLTCVVCWVISLVTDRLGDGLKFKDNTVVPFGCSTIGTTFCTPKAFRSEPEICLNFGTLNSANDRISTKKAINSVAISAKVAIHAGAPTGGHFGHSSCSSSISCAWASAIVLCLYLKGAGAGLGGDIQTAVTPFPAFLAFSGLNLRPFDPGYCAGTHCARYCADR